MGVRVGFGHSVRSAQIATEKRKGKLVLFLPSMNQTKKLPNHAEMDWASPYRCQATQLYESVLMEL